MKLAQSCLILCDPMDYIVHGILQARIPELGSLSLLQGIFPTQGSSPGLPHCRQILYQLSHKGSQDHRHNINCCTDILRNNFELIHKVESLLVSSWTSFVLGRRAWDSPPAQQVRQREHQLQPHFQEELSVLHGTDRHGAHAPGFTLH